MRWTVAAMMLLIARPGPACECQPADLRRAVSGAMVFVGVVEDVFPATTIEEYGKLIREIGAKRAAGRPALEARRIVLREIWGETLTPRDVARSEAARDLADLDYPFEDVRQTLPMRVRLRVSEALMGREQGSAEVFTAVGEGSCGVAFRVGQTYLVIARRRDESARWTTSVCSGTTISANASAEVITLREWKRTGAVPRSISGRVRDFTTRSLFSNNVRGVVIEARSGERSWRATVKGPDGKFELTDLPPGAFELKASLPGWRVFQVSLPRQVDLTDRYHADVEFMMERLPK
ncbi:MAG: hypothetical protein SFV54_24215 [Bryobacteraceae bacterium]|nr:hypothetical protein [Bryobacteraceae bacterium]